MAPTGTTKQITFQSLLSAVNTDLPPAVDWVNVTSTEYGAVGNGRADDALAHQRAIDYVNEIGAGVV
jgi:polygalacturonase